MNRFSKLAILLAVVVFFSACGPSTEKLALDKSESQISVMQVVLGQFASLRRVEVSGDSAVEVKREMVNNLQKVGLSLGTLSISRSELDLLVGNAYSKNARHQLEILRSKRTGPDEAQKARTEFYKTQHASGQPLGTFGVTSKTVDLLVASSYHRAEVANQGGLLPAKKAPLRRTAANHHSHR